MSEWLKVCEEDELEMDDVIGFEHEGNLYAVYKIKQGYYGTDGKCSHEKASLVDGYVEKTIVECPKHNARFDIISGKALKRPACIDISTYEIKADNGYLYILI